MTRVTHSWVLDLCAQCTTPWGVAGALSGRKTQPPQHRSRSTSSLPLRGPQSQTWGSVSLLRSRVGTAASSLLVLHEAALGPPSLPLSCWKGNQLQKPPAARNTWL